MTHRTLPPIVLTVALAVAFAATGLAQSKPTAKKPSSPWAQTDALVREKLGGTWQVARVATTSEGAMRVVLKDPKVTDSQYYTMVLATCSHLTQPKAPKSPKEIAFVNVHERTGYVLEAPDRCGEFLKLPPGKKTDIAIAAVTHLF